MACRYNGASTCLLHTNHRITKHYPEYAVIKTKLFSKKSLRDLYLTCIAYYL